LRLLCFGLHIYILTLLSGPLEDGLTYDSIIESSDSLDLTTACEFDDFSTMIIGEFDDSKPIQ
jgi:hypothetical protein